ncbi:MAG: hypothetical protein EOP83_23820 [Verrucomicrobiaceae bacterium]|nr:MAG: hypothetical protein EOP83_23820 [Verrucomicrobiaceae bacterium]
MRIALAAILLSTLSTAALADARTDSHATLTTIARWGVCLQDTMSDMQAKSMVYATVSKVDASFQRKYGQKATELAQAAYGDDFVQFYYNAAKADHAKLANRDATCRTLNQKVVALAQ